MTFFSCGVSFSAVREIAKSGKEHPKQTAQTVLAVRRVCLLLGVVGSVISASLAWPISQWVFEDRSHTAGVALLAFTILLSIVCGGQKALVQGQRRIGDLARIKILSVVLSSLLAVLIYSQLGQAGIVPALIVTGICNLSVSWYFARRIELVNISLSWRETRMEARSLIGLGAAFMWSMLLVALVDLFIRSLILQELGLESVGIYQASWAISGLFASFILNAMGADFYPRLTEVQDDHAEMTRLINEQTEIGILLSLPGLLATLVFAPWIMSLLYSAEFTAGADLLPWLVLGVFARVVAWPLGFVFLAKGAKGHYAFVETIIKIPRVLLVIYFIKEWGLVGAAIAWPLNYIFYFVIIYPLTHKMIGFHYQAKCIRLLLVAALIIGLTLIVVNCLSGVWALVASLSILLYGSYYSLRQLILRLDSQHRIVRLIKKFI